MESAVRRDLEARVKPIKSPQRLEPVCVYSCHWDRSAALLVGPSVSQSFSPSVSHTVSPLATQSVCQPVSVWHHLPSPSSVVC